MKRITSAQIAEDKFRNWLTVRNAYARKHETDGCIAVNEIRGREEYKTLHNALLSVANAQSPDHNLCINDLKQKFGGASIDHVVEMADGLRIKLNSIAANAIKSGATIENAHAVAMNSYFGNPGYDQFAGLNQLADQLYEQLTFVQSFIEEGDAVQLATEMATSAGATSRFRIPRVEVSGSAKQRLGDLNPYTVERLYSNNLAQISLINEFKNAITVDEPFIIDNNQEAALLGYARSIAPALAGFILQNQLFSAIDELVMKRIEGTFVDGWGSSAFDGETGNYGILSSGIMLALASAGLESPLLAAASDWASNPTKLIQQITNFNYKPASVSAPLPSVTSANAALIYADIVRLFNLIALTNVNTSGKIVLYVPTSFYSASVQYLGTGTFNRMLNESIEKATGGTIKNIVLKSSGLLNYRTNSLGATQYNHIVAVVHGAPTGKKGIVSPMATATPRVSTGVVSEQRSTFATELTFGGPMVIQRGQVFDLVFSVAS
jgi:hypothetical protein